MHNDDLLFTDIEGYKEILGFLFRSNDIEDYISVLSIATDDLREIVTDEVYDVILAICNGDIPEELEEKTQLAEKMVFWAKNFVAIFSYLDYASTNDLTHDTNGRRMQYSADEKHPFEWMIDREEANLMRRGYKALDRLLSLLDKSQLTAWTSTDNYEERRSLLIHSPAELKSFFAFDTHHHLYHIIRPFIKEAQFMDIAPRLGDDLLQQVLDARTKTGKIPAAQKRLHYMASVPLVLKSMALAVSRLSPKLLPSGLVDPYVSDRASTQASRAPESLDRISLVSSFRKQADEAIAQLEAYVRTLTESKPYTPISVRNKSVNSKYHSL
jgi:hypothetical protein